LGKAAVVAAVAAALAVMAAFLLWPLVSASRGGAGQRDETPAPAPMPGPVAAASPSGPAAEVPAPPAPPPFRGDPLEKPLVTGKDLVYLGAFSMPPKGGGGYSNVGTYGALTHRYVNGELRFLSTSYCYGGSRVYEVKFPGLSATSPPIARVVTDWNDIYGGKRWVDNDGGSADPRGSATYGLHWSEEARRLYWSYGNLYNATSPSNPCLGFSTLDDATGKATGVGAWRLRDRSEKVGRGGAVDIPSWFASRYTGGKRLGVGFGGYFSIISDGSLGPALCAVAHPDPDAVPHKGYIEQLPLLGYPFVPNPPGPPVRCQRNADYKTEFDGWKPSGDVGWWTWMDQLFGGGVWVDLPDKQAVLFFCVMGHGRVWYEKSDRHAERGQYWCLAFHPRDLAAVAQGRKKQWEVQPAASWEMAYGNDAGPKAGGWTGEPDRMVCGATFDAKSRRLYVLVRNVWKAEVEHYPRVYCWRLK
jgi:hypothetical protein